MKKVFGIVVAVLLLISFALAEVDLSSLSDKELQDLIENAQLELTHRAESKKTEYEWTENDFVFYDENMRVGLQPTSDPDLLSNWISMEKLENGQTFRGLKLDDYPEKVMALYDFSDATWELRDTEGKYGVSDRQKELTSKWEEQGYSGKDLLEQSAFLTSKGYGFLLTLRIYREDGEFRTASQLTYSGLDKEHIEEQIQTYSTSEYYKDTPAEDLRKYVTEYAKKKYCDQHLRASFMVSVFSGRVYAIELTDYYLGHLKDVYNDDGSINEKYAYVLDLK